LNDASSQQQGSQSSVPRDRLRLLLTVAATTSMALALRLLLLGAQSLWVDEAVTFVSSSGSLHDVIARTAANSNIPPLYYLVVHGFLHIGRSEFILRLPSVMFAVASIPLLHDVTRRWIGKTEAAYAAAFLALSPFHVWYSQDARPYSMLLFLALASLYLLEKLRSEPTRFRVILFAVTTASVFLCQTVGLAFIGFLFTYALLSDPVHRTVWMKRFAIVALFAVPGVVSLIGLPPRASAPERVFSLQDLAYTAYAFSAGYSLGPSTTELHQPDAAEFVRRALPWIVPVALLFGGLVVCGIARLAREHRAALLALSLWAVSALGFAAIGALATEHPYNVRYAILAFPPFIVVLSAGVTSFRVSVRRIAAAVVAVVFVTALSNYYRNERYFKEDHRDAVEHIRMHAEPGDMVLVTVPYVSSVFSYYDVGLPTLVYPLHPTPGVDSDSLDELLERLAVSGDRMWIYESRTFGRAPGADLIPALSARFRVDMSYEGPGVKVALVFPEEHPPTTLE